MVLLTHGYFIAEDLKEQQIMKPYVPLGLLSISAYLEQHQVNNSVFDSTFSSFDALCNELLNQKPRVLGIYVNLMTKLNVLRIIDFVKSQVSLKKTMIVLGGPELKHNAAHYLKAGADLLVLGEGEETFFELSQFLMQNDHLPKHILGTAYLSETGECLFNADRALIKDINSLPFPARHKVDLKAYGNAWKSRHGYSMYSISTMRGCPYTCKWCSRAVYGGTYRRRDPKLVVDEMEALQTNYQPDRLWFVDDVFTISHRWLRSFRDELLQRHLQIPYEIITRADRMNADVITLLKETGCFRVWIGAESGSQTIIDAMDRRVDVQQVRDMIIATRAAGIEAGTFIMLGYPGEGKKEIRETIHHLISASPNQYTITVAYPIAGTPLHDEVKTTLMGPAQWAMRTDRDLDFKRKHSKQYYQYAVRWVSNEVNLSQASHPLKQLKHRTNALLAQVLMWVHQ